MKILWHMAGRIRWVVPGGWVSCICCPLTEVQCSQKRAEQAGLAPGRWLVQYDVERSANPNVDTQCLSTSPKSKYLVFSGERTEKEPRSSSLWPLGLSVCFALEKIFCYNEACPPSKVTCHNSLHNGQGRCWNGPWTSLPHQLGCIGAWSTFPRPCLLSDTDYPENAKCSSVSPTT